MMGLLHWLANLLARFGMARRETVAEVELGDPEQAWRLVEDPVLWQLWMPGISDLLDRPRPLQAGAHFRVRMRMRGGRLGLGSGKGEAHVQVREFLPGRRLVWELLPGDHVEHYTLDRLGARVRCTTQGGEPAAAVVAELDRQSRPS